MTRCDKKIYTRYYIGEKNMIRQITAADKDEYCKMAREFYDSDAVLHPIPESHITTTFQQLMHESPYAEAYLFIENEKSVGYALLAKTFSQEAGGIVLWIEELYVRPAYRNLGYGSAFFAFLEKKCKSETTRLRLEVEDENERAIALYERLGFRRLAYSQMYKGK